MASPESARAVALSEEIAFWHKVLSTHGWKWPDEHRLRLDPEAPLQQGTRRWLHGIAGTTLNILDVGAGPLTILGKKLLDRQVNITAIDPLAAEYDKLLAELNITPPVRTILGDTLHLSEQFGFDRFDLVFCRNAMDHTPDPIEGIRECLKVVKPGAVVLLKHFQNEGVDQGYEQLHQWNFDVQDGKFILWSREKRFVVEDHVSDLCHEIHCDLKPDRWAVAALRRRMDLVHFGDQRS